MWDGHLSTFNLSKYRHILDGYAMEKTLAQLRTELDGLGECELLHELFEVVLPPTYRAFQKIDDFVKIQPVSAID